MKKNPSLWIKRLLNVIFLIALVSGETSEYRFTVARDLLPFGIPIEFSDDAAGVLEIEELTFCINEFSSLERERLELAVESSQLSFEAKYGPSNKRERKDNDLKDALDKQLDEIERSIAEESSLSRHIRQFLSRRTKYFELYTAFGVNCATRAYRPSDVRVLFPTGVSR